MSQPVPHQNGKGSRRRPGSLKAYEEGWERIFGATHKKSNTKNLTSPWKQAKVVDL